PVDRPHRRAGGNCRQVSRLSLQWKESGDRPRRDPLRQGQCRRYDEGDERGRPETGDVRGDHQGDKDFSVLITKMKEEGIDVIYYGGYPTEAGLIVRQARDQGFKAQFIGTSSLVTEDYWKISGPAGEGTLMTFPPDPRNMPAAWVVVDE